MKGFRKLIAKVHLWLGLFSGLVVFIVAVTGSLYAFEEELRNSWYSELQHVEAGKEKKPIDDLIATVKFAYADQTIKNIKLKNDATASVEIVLKNKQSVFVNPYTGKISGTADKENDFFGTVLQIHRTLYLGDAGKWITGISALIFVVILISGIIIWWPRNRQIRKHKFSVRKYANGKRLTYDFHSVLGFYASWIIIFTALSGLIWSFKWAEGTLYWVTGSVKEDHKSLQSEVVENGKTYPLQELISIAKKRSPLSKDCILGMPDDSKGVVRVICQYDNGGFFKKADQFFFDQYSGKMVRVRYFKNSSAGDKLKATNYNIHTGKVFGLIGKLIVLFASLVVASLPITGFLMWNRKQKQMKTAQVS